MKKLLEYIKVTNPAHLFLLHFCFCSGTFPRETLLRWSKIWVWTNQNPEIFGQILKLKPCVKETEWRLNEWLYWNRNGLKYCLKYGFRLFHAFRLFQSKAALIRLSLPPYILEMLKSNAEKSTEFLGCVL